MRRRVLHFNNTEEFEGGTELFFQKTCQELRKHHHVLAVSLSPLEGFTTDDKVVLKIARNRLLRLIGGVLLYPSVYRRLRQLLKQFKPDIVHLHNIDKYPLTTILAVRGYKVVKTVNDYGIICPTMWAVRKRSLVVCEAGFGFKCLRTCLNPFQWLVHAWLSFVKGPLYRKYINVFISPSTLQLEYLQQHGYRNVVLLENFLLHNKVKGKVKKISGSYFLYIGALTVQKGIYVMIGGFQRCNKDKKHKLVLIGAGEEAEKAREKYKDDPSIVFLGRVSDAEKFAYLRSCQAVIIPSLWIETGPHVGMETMLENKPIIASDIGGMTDYVLNGENGLFFKRGSSTDLTRKLSYFIKNRKRFKDIAAINKKQLAKYSTQRHMEKLLALYEHLHG